MKDACSFLLWVGTEACLNARGMARLIGGCRKDPDPHQDRCRERHVWLESVDASAEAPREALWHRWVGGFRRT